MVEIAKLVLYTDVMCYGPEPPVGEEIAQRVTLNANGRAAVTRYGYARGLDYERLQMARPRCDADVARGILEKVRAAFEDDVRLMVTDVGVWEAVLVLDDGTKVVERGSAIGDDGVYAGLSTSLREALGAPYLFAFDGGPCYGEGDEE